MSFLEQFNGRMIFMETDVNTADVEIFTDVAGSVGFESICRGSWCAERWLIYCVEKGWVKNLPLLELFPIVVAVVVWGKAFRNKKLFLLRQCCYSN